tara:strand:- start:5019 stop:5903 length:885 start_codon:yes stop_codon:yes gene_type:complete
MFLLCFYLMSPVIAHSAEPSPSSNVVKVKSIDVLRLFFKDIGYLETSWKNGQTIIPRFVFEGITNNWANKISELPSKSKKSVFFRLITPLILISNENILRERHVVETASLNDKSLIDIAVKYRILPFNAKQSEITLSEAQRFMLLERVDILPPSLAVVQAAKESGWGTSRFAREGNALFGQWDFTGEGIKPLLQREELGNYSIASFNTPLASVEGYMLNINTNEAYKDARRLRAEGRAKDQIVKGIELAPTLDQYSETGKIYTDDLQKMITFNELEILDTLTLSDETLIHLSNK